LHNLALFWFKNAYFFANVFGENLLKNHNIGPRLIGSGRSLLECNAVHILEKNLAKVLSRPASSRSSGGLTAGVQLMSCQITDNNFAGASNNELEVCPWQHSVGRAAREVCDGGNAWDQRLCPVWPDGANFRQLNLFYLSPSLWKLHE
jgi:hypothetical protein